ncbi:MAG: GTP 3',8-cyclase MoaA [Bacteroidota bacterium]|jgi:cyclic pyranopterin phosphate synthase
MKLTDRFNRVHKYLRISLTDKCNLNCLYCNPNAIHYDKLTKENILDFEEIQRIVRIFVNYFEFTKVRLTGGEPFARKNIGYLIELLGKIKIESPFELSATSNGTLLNGNLEKFIEKGLDRLNISLDSLNAETYKKISGTDKLSATLSVINQSISLGLKNIKINTVIMKGLNDNEINDFVEFAIEKKLNIRFIEYMPFSNNKYDNSKFIAYSDIKNIIETKFRLIEIANDSTSVSRDFNIFGTEAKVSFISSISDHFCGDCSRIRITADGKLKLCLFSITKDELDIKKIILNGSDDSEIAEKIQEHLMLKSESHPGIDELVNLKNNQMISIGG